MEPNIIYPTKINKYAGTIDHRGDNSYRYRLNKYKISQTFKTLEEAEIFMKRMSNELNETKNIIFEYPEHCEVELTLGKRTKFSKDDIEVIQSHVFCAIQNGKHDIYIAGCTVDDKFISLHRLFLDPPNDAEIDHINRDSLDNRRENLRIVNRQINCINRKIRNTNTSGVTGVYFNTKENCWIAKWSEIDGKTKRKNIYISKYGENAKQVAINIRKQKEIELDHYREALNL